MCLYFSEFNIIGFHDDLRWFRRYLSRLELHFPGKLKILAMELRPCWSLQNIIWCIFITITALTGAAYGQDYTEVYYWNGQLSIPRDNRTAIP
uniref:Uncharacterized protein n=1 Tax=Amphimedon queenslandica TaxID=400682 RepID=A0A1X7U1A8_AMPQE